MKAWIGVLVTIILLAVVGWFAKSMLLPLSPSPAPTPVPMRKKVPQMPASPPSQAAKTETEQMTSAQNPEPAIEQVSASPSMETLSDQANQPVAGVQETTIDTAARSQGAMEAGRSAPPPPQPIDLSQEEDVANETEPAPEPPPGVSVTEAPPAPDLPQSNKEPVPQSAKPQKEPEPIVETAAPPPAPAVTPTGSDKTTPFNIQVGAYLTRSYADDKLNSLKQLGYDAFIYRSTDAKRRTWYAVRFGWFASRDEASQALTEFKSKQGMDGIISRSDSL